MFFQFIVNFDSRIVKVSDHDIPSSGHKISLGLCFTPMGMMCVLSRLQASPEIL